MNKYISIGIIAWNEEKALGPMLNSLFEQSLFSELSKRKTACEIVCVANGCTDRTVEIARSVFADQARSNLHSGAFSCRVVDLKERGKINAWNQFVHSISAREARFLFLMDADILIHNRETVWNMLLTLENNAEASVVVDQPCKDIQFKARKTIRDRFSLAASQLTRSAQAQLCAQLYGIRSEIARNILLPKDLTACDDGFIKTLVCTDFLAHPSWPMRIQTAKNAAHTFEAYTSWKSLLKNQKRQMIGQTMVHILVDEYLKNLSPIERSKLAETLRRKEREDPAWLKRLINHHLHRTKFFWRLYPGLLTYRFKRLASLTLLKKVACFPVVTIGLVLSLISSFAATRFLKSGSVHYWPRADRNRLKLFGGRLSRMTH